MISLTGIMNGLLVRPNFFLSSMKNTLIQMERTIMKISDFRRDYNKD